MNKFCRMILAFAFLFSCESKQHKKEISIVKSPVAAPVLAKTKETTRFLNDCKRLAAGGYIGGIQGTKHSRDSTGLFGFIPCYDCSPTYEVILVLKGSFKQRKTAEYKTLTNEFDKGCAANFNNFDCFAFVVPLKDPEKQEDIHALNMDFPAEVKVYHRIDADSWQYDKTVNVKTFEAYSNLQFNVIYSQR